jgi:uncharacterized protein (DUF433 family)
VPIGLSLRRIAAGDSRDQLLTDYLRLETADLDAALDYPAAIIAGERPVAVHWHMT